MKKGFTLIEVTAVVVVLGIIALIAIPLVEQTLQNIRNDSYETQVRTILEGARQWGANNRFAEDFPKEDGQTHGITLEELKLSGFLVEEIKNPLTREPFDEGLRVNVTNRKGNIVYSLEGISVGGEYLEVPTLILEGDSLIYVDLGNTFNDPGASAYDSNGNPISVSSTIFEDDNVVGSINTNAFNRYTIVYTATANDYTARAVRTVIIYDSTPPTITFAPGINPTIFNSTVTSFDILNGVTATANDGRPAALNVRSNLMLGVPGEYIVTYIATDRFDNVSTKQRTVVINF